MGLALSIITPRGVVVEAEVDTAVVPGQEGMFGVLPGHVTSLMPLQPGVLRYREGGEETSLAVSSGFAEVTPDRVIVLVNTAELPQHIDRERATTAREKAEAEIRRLGAVSPEELSRVRGDLARAEARLDASG